MRRSWIALGTGLLMVGGALATAEEGFLTRPFTLIRRDWQRNNAWPDPFIPADRAAARQPLEVGTNAGWRLQNTLSDYHFDEQGQLTEAGELKVKAILQEHPYNRRFVLVVRADDPTIAANRMASTNEAAIRYALPGESPMLDETYIKPHPWPASYVYAVEQARAANMLPPVLPARPGSSTGGSSAGAAGS